MERFLAIDNLTPFGLGDAFLQLSTLLGGHARIKGVVEQPGLLDMLDQLAALGERKLGDQLYDLGLGLRHEVQIITQSRHTRWAGAANCKAAVCGA
jgi:hypothetical protein